MVRYRALAIGLRHKPDAETIAEACRRTGMYTAAINLRLERSQVPKARRYAQAVIDAAVGVFIPKVRDWTPGEDEILRRCFGTIRPDLLAVQFGRTRWATIERANVLKLTRGLCLNRKWESIEEARKRHGLAKKSLQLRLRRAGIPCGKSAGVYLRILKSDVDRAVAKWKPKPWAGGRPRKAVGNGGVE